MASTFRGPLTLLAVVILSQLAAAQDKPSESFVEFPDPVASYLKRLHNKQAGNPAVGLLTPDPDSPGGFRDWQQTQRKKLVTLLGLPVIQKSAGEHKPRVSFEKPIQENGYQRHRGNIETEPSVDVPFWLLIPDGKPAEPRPLALCVHGHDRDGWNTYAGVYRDEAHQKKTLANDGDVGVQAVQRGFVAITPATRGLATAVSMPDPKGRHGNRPCRAQLIHCLLAGRTAVGERVWDTQRILDWALSELPGIDKKKVALLGNSGGGVLTVYVAALDERITVAVPSCSFTSYTSSTGFVFHCDCCLVPRAQVELGDMSFIGALAAPRALLAVHGRQDALHSFPDVEAAMANVRNIYRAAGAPNRFQHKWGAAGHKFYPEFMWPFIESALE